MKTPLGTEVDLSPGHVVLDVVPALRKKGTAAAPLLFGPCLLWPQSPISASAELLFLFEAKVRSEIFTVIFGQPFVKSFAICYWTIVCPVCLWSLTLLYCGEMPG